MTIARLIFAVISDELKGVDSIVSIMGSFDDMSPCAFEPSLNEAKSEPIYYYQGLVDVLGDEGVWPLKQRYEDFARYVSFCPEDHVLDVGCAEGLISIEVAKQVRLVDALELSIERVKAARKLAEAQGLSNIRIEQGNIVDFQPPTEPYDVVMFLGVFHHLPKQHKLTTFIKLLTISKRMLVMRTPLMHKESPNRLINLYNIIEKMSFVVTIYPNGDQYGGNLMILTRND